MSSDTDLILTRNDIRLSYEVAVLASTFIILREANRHLFIFKINVN